MKITTENYGFHVAFKVPNDQSERMESFLDSHQDFMRETHHIEEILNQLSCAMR